MKANSPEQVRFAQAMREVGIFYQTKRGETVPRAYEAPYLNTDLVEIGKLCLAGIFQAPCLSRARPSSLYQKKYYEPIFNGNQAQIAKLCKELLYIDNYFRIQFQRDFDCQNNAMPNANVRISFAHNARTICIAFVAFATRYRQQNITLQDLAPIFSASASDGVLDALYETFRTLGQIQYFILPEIFNDKELYDSILKKLFSVIIEAGITNYSMACRYDTTLTPTNYLKKDKNYYDIISDQWSNILRGIDTIFEEIGM